MMRCSNYIEQTLAFTSAGWDVLDGARGWLSIKPVDRWYGGTNLSPFNVWRWSGREQALVKSV
jgi:hypothetical protein